MTLTDIDIRIRLPTNAKENTELKPIAMSDVYSTLRFFDEYLGKHSMSVTLEVSLCHRLLSPDRKAKKKECVLTMASNLVTDLY